MIVRSGTASVGSIARSVRKHIPMGAPRGNRRAVEALVRSAVGRVTLIDRNNQVIEHLGDSNAPNWNNPMRNRPREEFIAGQFICPHGACFDRAGNIFVVEWVEVGRVTKLRKVS